MIKENTKMPEQIIKVLFFIAIFTAMFVFFAYAHPLYLFDADDWTNISEHRVGVPVWGWWNPAKVLPEIMLPLAGDLGVWIIRPFVKDYVLSIMLGTTLVYVAVITLYVYELSALLKYKMSIQGGLNYLLSSFFLLLHFLILKTAPEDNPYLFYVPNITCAYHYIIPALLAASLVMYLMRTDLKSLTHLQMGFLYLATYLCVFSNLFQSMILAGYAGFVVLKALVLLVKKGKSSEESILAVPSSKNGSRANKLSCLLAFLKEHCYFLLILLMFLLACIFELSGGRAGNTREALHVGDSVRTFLAWPGKMNLLFRLMAAGVIAVLIGYKIFLRITCKETEKIGGNNFAKRKQEQQETEKRSVHDSAKRKQEQQETEKRSVHDSAKRKQEQQETEKCNVDYSANRKQDQQETETEPKRGKMGGAVIDTTYNDLALSGIFGFVSTSLFLILLSSVLSVFYIGSSDVFISAAFYLLLFLILTVGYLLKKIPVLVYAVPLICFVSLTVLMSGLRIFMNPRAVSSAECLAISRDFVRQVVEADQAGETGVQLIVPDYEIEENWPQPLYFGYRLANTLYRHGMTSKLMDVSTVPTAGYEPRETEAR